MSKPRRKRPTHKEMLACVLIERMPLQPHEKARMSADDVLRHFECHHMHPVALGGDNRPFNLAMLPKLEHRERTAEVDVPAIAKVKRGVAKRNGTRRRKSSPMPGSKASPWRKRMDGTVERRMP